eukprot:276762_1
MADDDVVVVPVDAENGYDDAAIRNEANLNSPKGQPPNNFQNDDDALGGGMSLNLEVEDDDVYGDDNNVTPNTKQRDQMDVNSPRAKRQQWSIPDEDESNAAVAGLVTQVARDDPNKQSGVSGAGGGGGVQALVTQVPRNDETQRIIQDKEVTVVKPGGICACFNCLWSCCSGPPSPADVPLPSTDPSSSQTTSYKNTDGSDTTNTMTKPENAKDSLLANSNGKEAKRNDPEEESISSTEYPQSLLPPLKQEHVGKKCLVLDLDETLVHSSFKPIPKPDFIIPVEIDRVVHHVYVLKRPYVDEFLLRASKHYEIVIFTASLSKYADPLLDKLDIHNVIAHRLFRESCVIHGTAYVKDMRRLGRKLKDSIIVDNSPPSYLFQPTNAVPIASWFDDPTDTQLLDFCGVIETTMKDVSDVRLLLDANNKSFRWLCNQAHQPLSKYTVRNDKINRQ